MKIILLRQKASSFVSSDLSRRSSSVAEKSFRGEQLSGSRVSSVRSKAGRGRILRYQIDIISVLTVMSVLGWQLTAYFLNFPWYFVLVMPPAIRALHLVEHNHAHLKIFRPFLLNEILGWMCFISNGVPLECYELHHVQNHHRFTQRFGEKDYDWSSTFGFVGTSYPEKPMGRLYYCLTYAPLAWLHCWIEILRRPGQTIFWRFLTSFTLCIGISALLLALNPVQYLIFFGLPWVMAYIGMGNANYEHHLNCELTTPYNSARVNLTLLFRSLGFNIGYHVAHHLKPTLHWSLLPKYHELLKNKIPEENYVVSSGHPINWKRPQPGRETILRH